MVCPSRATVYLDFITLMIEGGLNLTGAMQVAVDKGPPGPLRNEFGVMIRDLRAGTSKTDIFRRFFYVVTPGNFSTTIKLHNGIRFNGHPPPSLRWLTAPHRALPCHVARRFDSP